MKQVVRSLSNGRTAVVEVPAPRVRPGCLLIASRLSLVSAGLEPTLVASAENGGRGAAVTKSGGRGRWLRALATEGLFELFPPEADGLDGRIQVGCSTVGTVVDVGSGVPDFLIGDRVVTVGAHAEIISEPADRCAKVPDSVLDDDAVYTVASAVCLHAIRLAAPTMGDLYAVMGLGLTGLLVCMLLRAHGCEVLGLDRREERRAFAGDVGFSSANPADWNEVLRAAGSASRWRGLDGVIVTSTSRASDPIRLAAQICRGRGRIVLLGASGLALDRAALSEKELSFQIAWVRREGKNDPADGGAILDFPAEPDRWTEQRNLEAILDRMAADSFRPSRLTTHRVGIDEADEAYRLLLHTGSNLGVLITYGPTPSASGAGGTLRLLQPRSTHGSKRATSVLGLGDCAERVLIPGFRRAGVALHRIVSPDGFGAEQAARRFGFEIASTDAEEAVADPAVENVVIAGPIDDLFELTVRALTAGKNLFIQQPPATNREELSLLSDLLHDLADAGKLPVLAVGFNRRFSEHAIRIRKRIGRRREPALFVYTINAAPPIPWSRAVDPGIAPGRILGGACHFIDLLRFLAGSPIVSVSTSPLFAASGGSATITLHFADGSTGVINYLLNGHRSFPKERLDLFCAGEVYEIDDFRKLRSFGVFVGVLLRTLRPERGHRGCIDAFLRAVGGTAPAPIPLEELLEVMRISIEVDDALACGSAAGEAE